MKVLRMTDRIHLKVDGAVFVMAPLSADRKQEIARCTKIVNGETVLNLFEVQRLYLKHGLKEIIGVTDFYGEPYRLELIEGALTDGCISEVLMIAGKEKIMTAAMQVMNGVPEKIVNPLDGEVLEGVSLEVKKA